MGSSREHQHPLPWHPQPSCHPEGARPSTARERDRRTYAFIGLPTTEFHPHGRGRPSAASV